MRRYASLRGRREFALVLRRGRAASAKHLVVFAFSPSASRGSEKFSRPARWQRKASTSGSAAIAKVGIIITKKVGKAVVRNLLRRRCKSILDRSAVASSGAWYVVQCRPHAAELSYAQLRDQLLHALSQSLEQAGTKLQRRETARS